MKGRLYNSSTGEIHPGRGIMMLVLIAVVLWGITAGIWGLGVATAGLYGRGEAHKQIQSAGTRIGAYDHFFNLCAAVQGLEGSLAAQHEALDATKDQDEQERLRANIAGIEAARAQSIAQYNADARKSYTIGQFRSSDLPFELDVNERETSCEA